MSRKEIIEAGKVYSKANIMDNPYKYFSKRNLQCNDCGKFVVRAAYSTNATSGYFKTAKGLVHDPSCSWEKAGKYVPKKPSEKLLNRIIAGMKKPKPPSKPGAYHKPISKRSTSSIKMFEIKKDKQIIKGDRSAFKYKGRVNNIGYHNGFTYISLFKDSKNGNIRISVPDSVETPKVPGNYYLAIESGLPTNTRSIIYNGVDIEVADKMYKFEKY